MPPERVAPAAELERRLAELQEELARLTRRIAEQDDFLATLAHELRTPLNAILGWSTLLGTGRLDAATRERAIATIERNARAQTRLIEDALEAARIASGRLTLQRVAVDLRRVVEAALETMQPAAQARQVRLKAQLAEACVLGDGARLQQVVCNLLSNAIKFSAAGGEVEVLLERAGAEGHIRVRDHGEGIHADLVPRLFERIPQRDGAHGARPGGLGIGLAIVRHLTQMHGGSVTAHSEGEGRGATLTVRLPLLPGTTDDPT